MVGYFQGRAHQQKPVSLHSRKRRRELHVVRLLLQSGCLSRSLVERRRIPAGKLSMSAQGLFGIDVPILFPWGCAGLVATLEIAAKTCLCGFPSREELSYCARAPVPASLSGCLEMSRHARGFLKSSGFLLPLHTKEHRAVPSQKEVCLRNGTSTDSCKHRKVETCIYIHM